MFCSISVFVHEHVVYVRSLPCGEIENNSYLHDDWRRTEEERKIRDTFLEWKYKGEGQVISCRRYVCFLAECTSVENVASIVSRLPTIIYARSLSTLTWTSSTQIGQLLPLLSPKSKCQLPCLQTKQTFLLCLCVGVCKCVCRRVCVWYHFNARR